MFETQISEKQLKANRQNAQKSTGPTSDEGKQKTRANASRHHLTGQVFTMTDQDRAQYNKFLDAFTHDYQPEGALLTNLVASVAQGFWRLNRANAMEENYFTLEIVGREPRVITEIPQIQVALCQALTFFENPEKFALLTLYEQRIHRKLQKDLKLLLELDAKRDKQPKPCAEPVVEPLAAKPATHAASATCGENGFVFSNALPSAPEPAADAEIAPQTAIPDPEIPKAA